MTITLFAKVEGQGEPIILLHGLFGSAANLGSIAALLATDYEVHSLDLRNHGDSPHTEAMTYELMAQDVIDYMAQTGLDCANVLGHSLGGKVAMTLALAHPDRVARLIVADIAPVSYPSQHEVIFNGLLALDLATLKSRAEADKALSAYILDKDVRQFLLKNLKRTPQGNFVWKANLASIYRNYHQLCKGLPSNRSFAGKVLFVAGEWSDYLKASDQELIQTLFPQAVIRVIPGTSHWLHAEKPAEFASVCRRFLEE